MNIFICEDELSHLQHVVSIVEKVINRKSLIGKVKLASQNPNTLLKAIKENLIAKYDINNFNVYILDINLATRMNGMELARKIRECDPLGYIIFITGHIECSMTVYKHYLKAFDYIIKPVDYTDIERTILSIQEDYKEICDTVLKTKEAFMAIKSKLGKHVIKSNEIIFIEKKNRKVIVNTYDRCYSTNLTMKKIENELKSNPLIMRLHRSYMVNRKCIKGIDKTNMEVILEDEIRIPVSRSYRKVLNNIIR